MRNDYVRGLLRLFPVASICPDEVRFTRPLSAKETEAFEDTCVKLKMNPRITSTSACYGVMQ